MFRANYLNNPFSEEDIQMAKGCKKLLSVMSCQGNADLD
jgi:hypothetical protein